MENFKNQNLKSSMNKNQTKTKGILRYMKKVIDIEDIRVGFIGFGNMGKAVAKGLIRAGMPSKNITACARDWDKLVKNCEEMNTIPCRDVYESAYYSDLVFVAIKPYQVESVLEDYKDVLQEKAVISVAAGLGFDWYEEFLDEGTQHLSIIPNTAVEIGRGVILKEKTHSLQGEILEKSDVLLKSLGHVEEVDGELMDVASGISGCGGAFVYMFLEAMADGAVKNGLPRKLAYRLAAEMLEGAGALYLSNEKHPGELKDEICSPNGTTIKGVAALESNAFRSAVIQAVDSTLRKG